MTRHNFISSGEQIFSNIPLSSFCNNSADANFVCNTENQIPDPEGMTSLRQAFSLVELSIVLVILGLLTGGILSGQSLIRAAELRAVTTEYNRYVSAVSTFKDKYFALPGDMPNAVRFWGAQAGGNTDGYDATCEALTTAAVGTATCNGNGDGAIHMISSGWYERFRFWQHLANAGLIEGRYSGVTNGAATTQSVLAGTNAPKSKMSNGGWFDGWWGTQTGSYANYWSGDYGNVLLFAAGGNDGSAILKPEEAWNIDTKLDDGLPGSGRVMSSAPGDNPNCTSGGTSTTPSSASYALGTTSIACSLFFTKI